MPIQQPNPLSKSAPLNRLQPGPLNPPNVFQQNNQQLNPQQAGWKPSVIAPIAQQKGDLSTAFSRNLFSPNQQQTQLPVKQPLISTKIAHPIQILFREINEGLNKQAAPLPELPPRHETLLGNVPVASPNIKPFSGRGAPTGVDIATMAHQSATNNKPLLPPLRDSGAHARFLASLHNNYGNKGFSNIADKVKQEYYSPRIGPDMGDIPPFSAAFHQKLNYGHEPFWKSLRGDTEQRLGNSMFNHAVLPKPGRITDRGAASAETWLTTDGKIGINYSNSGMIPASSPHGISPHTPVSNAAHEGVHYLGSLATNPAFRTGDVQSTAISEFPTMLTDHLVGHELGRRTALTAMQMRTPAQVMGSMTGGLPSALGAIAGNEAAASQQQYRMFPDTNHAGIGPFDNYLRDIHHRATRAGFFDPQSAEQTLSIYPSLQGAMPSLDKDILSWQRGVK